MPKTRKPASTTTFEEALDNLESIVQELEAGQLGLSDALKRYEEGIQGLKFCHQILEETERKIELLSGVDAEGNPVSEPFDESSTAPDEEKEPTTRRRKPKKRAARVSPSDEVDDSGTLF